MQSSSRISKTLTCCLLPLILSVILAIALAGCGSSNHSMAGTNTTPNPNPGGTSGGGGGGSGGGGGGGGGGTGGGGAPPKFVYALNGSAGPNAGVAEFTIDQNTGALSRFGIASVPSIQSTEGGMAATPQTGFVYVAQWLPKDIVILRADPTTGALTQTNVFSVPELQSPPDMLIDPTGKFLYVADPNGFQVIAFQIQTNGDLVRLAGSPFKISEAPVGLTMDSAGKFLFVSTDHIVFGFAVGSNGALVPTPGSPVTVRPTFITPGKGPTNIRAVIDPGARFLFVGDNTAPQMFVYTVAANGALTQVAGSPFKTDTVGRKPAVDREGKFVYIPDAIVAAMAVNQTTGALTAVHGSPFDNGPFRNGGAPVCDATPDTSNKFLLLADCQNSAITVFTINPTSGELTNVTGSPFQVADHPIGGGSPSSIAVTH